MPETTKDDVLACIPVAFCSAAAHSFSVFALSGAVALRHDFSLTLLPACSTLGLLVPCPCSRSTRSHTLVPPQLPLHGAACAFGYIEAGVVAVAARVFNFACVPSRESKRGPC